MNEINDVPVLLCGVIEARITAPLSEAFADKLGHEKAVEIASNVILNLAVKSGAELAKRCGGNSFEQLADGMGQWSAGGAIERNVIERDETKYNYNIVKCKYADMYKELDLAELGFVLSCGRDGMLFGGFNPDIKFERTQTIMEGAEHYDFRLSLDRKAKE